ncbi:hypothetical protein [Hyphomonas jannaschiana]|uniref:hypothetical protein n=1 Tax=Hyphomonas jannaschiana TaxID=86 RepID=UPI0035C6B0EE
MPDQLISLLAGFVGVLAGGAITFWIQWYFTRRAEKAARRVQVIKIQHCIRQAANDVAVWNKQLREDIPSKHKGELWPYVQGYIGFNDQPIIVGAEDLSVFSAPKTAEFANEILLLVEIRNAVANAILHYNDVRKSLTESLTPLATEISEENFIMTGVDLRAHPEIAAQKGQCESLVKSIFELLEDGKRVSKSIGGAFGENTKAVLGKKSQLGLAFACDEN